MQSVSSRIWTRIAVFISYGDNDYTTTIIMIIIIFSFLKSFTAFFYQRPRGSKSVGYMHSCFFENSFGRYFSVILKVLSKGDEQLCKVQFLYNSYRLGLPGFLYMFLSILFRSYDRLSVLRCFFFLYFYFKLFDSTHFITLRLIWYYILALTYQLEGIFLFYSLCSLFLFIFLSVWMAKSKRKVDSLVSIIIILLLREFFAQAFADVFHRSHSDSKSSQASRTLLSISANLNNVVVWMVSTHPLIWKYSSPSTKPLVPVPSAPIAIGITIIFSKSRRILYCSFSRTDSGLWIYHFVVWPNLNFLSNSQ